MKSVPENIREEVLSNENEQVILSQMYIASVSWEISSGDTFPMKGNVLRKDAPQEASGDQDEDARQDDQQGGVGQAGDPANQGLTNNLSCWLCKATLQVDHLRKCLGCQEVGFFRLDTGLWHLVSDVGEHKEHMMIARPGQKSFLCFSRDFF